MEFIPLTLAETGRTIHVRACAIVSFVEYINDDEAKRCTRLHVCHSGIEMEVLETPEKILQLIREVGQSK